MTAEYEITRDDFRAFNLYHHRHSPTARRQYLLSWLVPAFMSHINAMAAIIVPRRAFAGPSEFAEFVRTASMYHEKALNQG